VLAGQTDPQKLLTPACRRPRSKSAAEVRGVLAGVGVAEASDADCRLLQGICRCAIRFYTCFTHDAHVEKSARGPR
jgi:hypothetical protein